MFENLFMKKNFYVKDLYVAYPAIVTRDNNTGNVVYNGSEPGVNMIIVKKVGPKYVRNVLTGRQYGIFKDYNFIREYMVSRLFPLEDFLKDKNKIVITRDEIIEFLYPKIMEETTYKYKDVVLQKIYEVNEKINKSSLSEGEKDKLKFSLIELANYYVNTLKNFNNTKKDGITLEVNQKSIISLKQEIIGKILEIEMVLPPENINNLVMELAMLESDIKTKN